MYATVVLLVVFSSFIYVVYEGHTFGIITPVIALLRLVGWIETRFYAWPFFTGMLLVFYLGSLLCVAMMLLCVAVSGVLHRCGCARAAAAVDAVLFVPPVPDKPE